MSIIRMAGALALVMTLPACATVVRGTKQSFVIDSEPTSAVATLSTGQTCTTPCSLKVKRKDPFTVHVTHDGYQPVDASVTSETRAGAVAGNILLGGLIGAGVDAADGSLKSLVPNPLHVKMVSLEAPAAEPIVPTPPADAAAPSAPLPETTTPPAATPATEPSPAATPVASTAAEKPAS